MSVLQSDLDIKLRNLQNITNQFVIFPNLDSVGDYILRNEAGLKNHM